MDDVLYFSCWIDGCNACDDYDCDCCHHLNQIYEPGWGWVNGDD